MEKIRSKYEKEIIVSLFKQMALAISLMIIILLGSIMTLNYQSSKKDMLENLYQTTANNISSLASQLAEAGSDKALISSVIDAEFDSGYFKKITFTSNDGSFVYTQEDHDALADLPQWFVDFTDISLQSVQADVTSGWEVLGVVRVTGDTSIVYKALYKMFLQLFTIFTIAVLVSLLLLSIVLKILLRPLKRVQKQAEAIAKNKFILQEEIPYTTEFRDVVLGMNAMVTKVKAMFDKGNQALKEQKEREYTDPVTQLKNRQYLIDKLPEFLKIDATSKGGIFMMLAFSGIIEANEKLGHRQVDILFKEFADRLLETVSAFEEAIVLRMNGTEFALFIPDYKMFHALTHAHDIVHFTQNVVKENALEGETTFLSIGIYQYNYQESIASLLSQADNALAQAKLQTEKVFLATPANITEVMGKDAWRKIITTAIEKEAFEFISWATMNVQTQAVVHYALSLTLEGEKSYSYGQFMAPANQIGLSHAIYTSALNMLFKKPHKNLHHRTCSLRLPYEFLTKEETFTQMQVLLQSYAQKLPLKLIIEMPDKLMSQNTELAQQYKTLLEKYSIDLGIFEFIGESKDYHYLQTLRPLYIKAHYEYFLSKNNQTFTPLKLLTESMNIQLIASGVMDMQTLDALSQKDVFTVQGKVIEQLKSSGV